MEMYTLSVVLRFISISREVLHTELDLESYYIYINCISLFLYDIKVFSTSFSNYNYALRHKILKIF